MPNNHSSQKRSGEISNQKNSNANKKIEYWGHKMRAKNGNTLRICFHNTNGLPLTNNHHKNEAIYNFLSKHQKIIFYSQGYSNNLHIILQ